MATKDSYYFFFKNLPGLFILCFIEGGVVLSMESVSVQILSPFFGNSTLLWSAILSLSLTGITLGYLFAARTKLINPFKTISIWSSCLVINLWLIFYSGDYILNITQDFNLTTGILFSAFIFLTPILFLCGGLSPLIIQILNNNKNFSGKTAGTVYSLSTLGGVMITFIMIFYLIPLWGIKISFMLLGFFVLLNIMILYFFDRKKLLSSQKNV